MAYKLKVYFEGMFIVDWRKEPTTIHLIDGRNARPSRDLAEPTSLLRCSPQIAIPHGFWRAGDPADGHQLGMLLYDLDQADVDFTTGQDLDFERIGPVDRPGPEPNVQNDPDAESYFCWIPSLREIQPEVSTAYPLDPRSVVARIPLREGKLGSHSLSPVVWSFRPEADLDQVLPNGAMLELEGLEDDLTVTITERERIRTIRVGPGNTGFQEVGFFVRNTPDPNPEVQPDSRRHFKWHQEAIQVSQPIPGRFSSPRHARPRLTPGKGRPGGTGETCPPTRYP